MSSTIQPTASGVNILIKGNREWGMMARDCRGRTVSGAFSGTQIYLFLLRLSHALFVSVRIQRSSFKTMAFMQIQDPFNETRLVRGTGYTDLLLASTGKHKIFHSCFNNTSHSYFSWCIRVNSLHEPIVFNPPITCRWLPRASLSQKKHVEFRGNQHAFE